jgi:tetratricopeptide (TPR) repeat protein
MEGAGVQDAAWLGGESSLVVRGTCDYCNEKKDDRWQKYAALIAATFARSVVEALPAPSSSAAVEMPPCSPSGIGQSFGRISITGPVTILNTSSDVYLVIGGEDSLSAYARNSVEFVTVPDLPREVTKPMIVGGQFKETLARLVADMRRDLSAWRYEQAERAAETLDRLLSVHEADLSDDDVRSGAILVARVYINRAEGTVGKKERSLHRARALLERIERNVAGLNADIIAEVTALKASLESLAVGPDAALELIEGRTDPYAIRTRVALFLKQRKVFEAVQALAGLDPHERWCDVAVAAYVLNGEVEKANCLMHWAADLPDRTRHAQCVLMQADALMGQALAGHQEGESILPHDVSMQEREALQGVLEVLGPVLRAIGTAGGPRSGIDVAALRIAWHANHLLERTETVAALLGLLGKWEPVPVDVARGVVGGYIEAPASLPDRLVRDHPGDLDAGILAAVIQSVSLGQHKEAFAKAKELLPLADSDEKKEELSRVLQQVWQNLEGPEMAECETLAESLVLHNPRLQAIFGGLVALRSGDADRAISALDGQKSEDDPYWLQVRGNALLQKQQAAEAVDFLLVAAKKTRAPGLLQRTSDIAFQAGRHDVAVWCNETLAEIQPRNLPVRHNLAHIYTFVLHDMERAAVQFKALSELEPQNSIHTLNLAVCLAQLFRPEESLGLYESLCAHENPTLQAVLGRAQLHHSMGRPDAALASLETFRERFWGEPDFLLAYMATAHAAGNNEAAHEALMALNQLREAGRLGSETLRVLHQDEGLEIIKQSFREGQERTDKFHAEMLKGRMPWVWAEQMSRTAIYWGWRTRTQEMGWIGDDPTNRARFSIYSTNGFHARESERGRRELMPLECPAPGTRVVADVSALITLHRLGLLDEAAQYFDEILVPAGYLPTVLEDSRQMVLGQRSQRQEAEQIVKAVNIGQIVTIAEGSETAAATPIADEYVEVAAHRYRLTDVVRPLYAAGLLSEVVFSRVSHVCTKPSAVDETHPALSQFKDLMVDLATLETIAQVGLLDAVAGFYGLQITAQAHREVIQRLNAIEYQEETRGWHIDLWSRLRRDARFKFVPHTVPEELRGKDKELKEYLPFLSCFIALQTKTPLMADDRTCQAFTLNGMADVSNAAFGSDVVILALMTGGRLDAGRAAVAIRRLMAWRYRFIVPPPEILKALADEYRGNSPGEALREIAEYVHDCMRDTGLFGGRENTAIGDSMAMRCYLAWIRNIAEFLVLIWADEGYAPESAAHLTEWSCREFLPSCPRVMEAHGRVEVTSLTPRLFLSHALLNMVNRNGGQRFADAMKEMKEALRLTDDEYTRIITGILQDAARTAHQS